MPSIETLITILKLAGVVLPPLGLILLIVGLRGRRVGDAPHCRKCKYNLTGVPSTRCPECGHDLTAPNATRIGQRQRRKAPLALGALFLVIALTGWSGEAYRQVRQIDPYSLYPFALLLEETRAGNLTAFDEIEKRYYASDLADIQVTRFIEMFLEMDGSADWTDSSIPLQSFFHQLIIDGYTTPEDEDRYFRRAGFELAIRNRIRAEDPLPYGLFFNLAVTDDAFVDVLAHEERFDLDGTTLTLKFGKELHYVEPRSRVTTRVFTLSGCGLPERTFLTGHSSVLPGTHTLTYEATVPLTIIDRRARGTPRTVRQENIPLRLRETIQIAPPDIELIQLLDRPELKDRLRELIRIEPYSYSGASDSEALLCTLVIALGNPEKDDPMPVNVAFDVVITNGQDESIVSRVSCPEGRARRFDPYVILPEFVKDSLTVILRPSLEAAKDTYDMYTIFGSELTYDDIKIVSP